MVLHRPVSFFRVQTPKWTASGWIFKIRSNFSCIPLSCSSTLPQPLQWQNAISSSSSSRYCWNAPDLLWNAVKQAAPVQPFVAFKQVKITIFFVGCSSFPFFWTTKQNTCADNGSTRIQTKTSPQKAGMFPSFVTVLYIAEFITGFMAGLLAYASTQTFAFSRFPQWHHESCSANTVAGLHRIFTCFPFNHPTLKQIGWTNHNPTIFNCIFIIFFHISEVKGKFLDFLDFFAWNLMDRPMIGYKDADKNWLS